MSIRCTRCRALDGAHHAWCIQAVLWERTTSGTVEVNGSLPTWNETEDDTPSFGDESDLVADLREHLAAARHASDVLLQERDSLQGEVALLRDANEAVGHTLDGSRDEAETVRQLAMSRVEQIQAELSAARAEIARLQGAVTEASKRPAADMSVIDTGDITTALQEELAQVKLSVGAQQTLINMIQGELRTARQQRDLALRERDQTRRTINDPAALREQRRREAEEIRTLAAQSQAASGERVVDRDAGQQYEDLPRPTPETVRERMERTAQAAAGAALAVAEADGTLGEAQAAAREAGAQLVVEVVEQPPLLSMDEQLAAVARGEDPDAAEQQAMVDYATEATERESAPSRGKGMDDVATAAELFVSDQIEQVADAKLNSRDLLPAFRAWAAGQEIEVKVGDQLVSRLLGAAMIAAEFGRRQYPDPVRGGAPVHYVGARLKVETPKEGVHPSRLSTPREETNAVEAITNMRRAAQEAKRPSAQLVAGNPDLPGKELRDNTLRDMAVTLVKEQGWTYKRPTGHGHPRLVSPSGQVKKLATTPGDQRGIARARADLRRMGADL